MIEKRYQVFVSSTFKDLQDERREVMQALLELDCIPAGMELFPAADEDQWTLIKNVIDDCDYYVVIVAGRYGSVGPDGMSFTEMEYRYALDSGKPILSFLHKDPQDLPASKVEKEKESLSKLQDFRSFVQRKVCRYWTSASELGGIVSRSMIRLIKHTPAIGWVRADQVPPEDTVREVLELRRRLEAAEKKAQDFVQGASEVGLLRAIAKQGDFGTESDWLSLIASASERVDLMGRTLYGWTESSEVEELISRKIQEDQVEFRWLVMSPENRFLPVLEENAVNIGTRLKAKLDAVESFLGRIRESLPTGCKSLLRIRRFRAVPLYFGYMRVDDRFLVTHYMCSANSGSSPMFCLEHSRAAWSKNYLREFDAIWRMSSDEDTEHCA